MSNGNDKPKLFISHASADTGLAVQIQHVLQARFDVLLDAVRLQPGDDWQHRLESWMTVCDAAIVLLSEWAEASEWVRAEAYNLSKRRRLEGPELMTLVPVLVGGFTLNALKEGAFHPSRLHEYQYLHLDLPDPDLDALVQALSPVAERFNGEAVCPVVERVVADRLAGLRRNGREEVARALGLDHPEMLADDSRSFVRLARRILHLQPAGLCRFIETLRCYMPVSHALEVFEMTAPFCILESPQTDAFSYLALLPVRERAVLITARYENTPHWYIRRASRRAPPWRVLLLNAHWDDDPEQGLRRELRQSLMGPLGLKQEHYDARYPRALESYRNLFGPVVVRLPDELAAMDTELLADLVHDHPELVFVLRLEASPQEFGQGDERLLWLPALEEDYESDVDILYNQVVDSLQDSH